MREASEITIDLQIVHFFFLEPLVKNQNQTEKDRYGIGSPIITTF